VIRAICEIWIIPKLCPLSPFAPSSYGSSAHVGDGRGTCGMHALLPILSYYLKFPEHNWDVTARSAKMSCTTSLTELHYGHTWPVNKCTSFPVSVVAWSRTCRPIMSCLKTQSTSMPSDCHFDLHYKPNSFSDWPPPATAGSLHAA